MSHDLMLIEDLDTDMENARKLVASVHEGHVEAAGIPYVLSLALHIMSRAQDRLTRIVWS